MMDALFLRQVWAGNEACCCGSSPTTRPLGRARLHAFLLNKGPWSRLDHDAPFLPGVPAKPGGAELLPGRRHQGGGRGVDEACPPPSAQRATGFFTTMRRAPPGAQPSPWSPTASSTRASWRAPPQLLREAAALTAAADAEARSSRRAPPRSSPTTTTPATWPGWSSTRRIEPTIGPYEVYEDEWFNDKAAFEAFITVRDDAETAEAGAFSRRAAGHREPPAHRPAAAQPQARRARAHPRGERDLLRRATPTAACRPPPTTCPTTSASRRRRAPSG